MSVATEKSPKLQTVETLFDAMKRKDWTTIKSCLTEDVFYRVGSSEPVHGPEEVQKYLSGLYEIASFEYADVRQVLEPEGQVIFEMESHYRRLADNRPISFACTDILRVRGDKIREWRVYVDISPLFAE
ncbi:nuclear transport factor 2 family protein [Nostocaceae cyanobacterium CENA369]|uniref:Nuclear transport factor 2 family protein n=1 Tax=Dendronalium phyllosphericum CENA369 TaxID=1725256 RepID=A0A8J7I5F0_9NOST|nr:nuclear transport factor 2 family protein [Dendronalium phyllosphericum]MBH8574397.1 nuclear transport factor 2 family protein [Dendronalium phyllosphericum CENA369]MBH8574398.1 nuclear transport factor 2 family protein [Dendronalium phyllosphericum CENA369]